MSDDEPKYKVLVISQGCYAHSFPMSYYMAEVWVMYMRSNYGVRKYDLEIVEVKV